MIEIEWLYEENKVFETLIVKSIATALEEEGVITPVDIVVTIVNNEEIQTINLAQRNIDRPTDVLSFPMIDYEGFEDVLTAIKAELVNPETNHVYLGDIVLSWDKVLEQQADFGHSLEREVSFLIVHSVLHLLGYDHMEEDERLIMEAHQNTIMESLGILR